MKIRTKLSIQFTVLVTTILVFFCLIIYYISTVQHRIEFYKVLQDRAYITAYMYLEEDGFPPEIYRTIRERYLQRLPNESALLFDEYNMPKFVEEGEGVVFNDDILEYIRANYVYPESYNFRKGNIQSVGLFYPDNQGDFVVIVSAFDVNAEIFLNNLAWLLGSGCMLSLIILFIAGHFFSRQALRPIPKIVNQVNNISASNLFTRLKAGKENDEISELIDTFNNLLHRLEENFNLQKRFVANASHELRTPLTSIIGEIEVTVVKDRTVTEYKEILNSIYHDALKLHELISGLLNIAQAESEKLNMLLKPVRVDELVLETCLLIEKKYPGSKVNINYSDSHTKNDDYLLSSNWSLLYHVFLNVMDNAVKFSHDKPHINVTLASNKKEISVNIRDHGIGVRKEEVDRIFDPFYRSKDVIGYYGYGIGLSLVKRILSILNGEIQISSTHGKGTNASIIFHK